MSSCADCFAPSLMRSEIAMVGRSAPPPRAGFDAVYVGLHGPYDAMGRPFGTVPNTRRTARTRHFTVENQLCSV
jgi:hypothetical protein